MVATVDRTKLPTNDKGIPLVPMFTRSVDADGNAVGSDAPGTSYAAVTKSDSTVLTAVRALYVGTTGDVAVRSPGSSTSVTFKAVPAGAFLPILVEKVMSTGTTAADIVALY